MAESQFISFEDALEELQMDENQLKSLVEGGVIQSFMDGGKQMFKRTDIEEYKRKAETDQTVVFAEDSSDETDADVAEETSQIFLIDEGDEAAADVPEVGREESKTELFSEFLSESVEDTDKDDSTSSLELEDGKSEKDGSTSTIDLSGEEEDKDGSTSKIDTATIETLLSDDDSDQTSSLPVAAAPDKESDDPIFDFDEEVGISVEGEGESGGSSAETGILLDDSSSDILGTVDDEESSSELALEISEEDELMPTVGDEDESDTALQAIDLGETPGVEGETTDDVTGDLLEIVEGEGEGGEVVDVLEMAEDEAETAATAEAGIVDTGIEAMDEEPSDTALLEAEEIEEDVAYEGIAEPAGPAFRPYATAPTSHGLFTFFLIAATLLMVYTTIVLINMTIGHTNLFTDWVPGVFNK